MKRKIPKYTEPIRINLGCGEKEGDYIGIDIRDCGQKMIWDIKDGLPFPDESVDEIYSCHFLEHLDDEETIDLLVEVARVLKKGGKFENRLPHQQHPTAFYIGHKTFWNEARIESLPRVLQIIGKFKILRNGRMGSELYFTIEKI
jgi:predicted SAM-dependent methyltransferase